MTGFRMGFSVRVKVSVRVRVGVRDRGCHSVEGRV